MVDRTGTMPARGERASEIVPVGHVLEADEFLAECLGRRIVGEDTAGDRHAPEVIGWLRSDTVVALFSARNVFGHGLRWNPTDRAGGTVGDFSASSNRQRPVSVLVHTYASTISFYIRVHQWDSRVKQCRAPENS